MLGHGILHLRARHEVACALMAMFQGAGATARQVHLAAGACLGYRLVDGGVWASGRSSGVTAADVAVLVGNVRGSIMDRLSPLASERA
jgi:hypothetical protein